MERNLPGEASLRSDKRESFVRETRRQRSRLGRQEVYTFGLLVKVAVLQVK